MQLMQPMSLIEEIQSDLEAIGYRLAEILDSEELFTDEEYRSLEEMQGSSSHLFRRTLHLTQDLRNRIMQRDLLKEEEEMEYADQETEGCL